MTMNETRRTMKRTEKYSRTRIYRKNFRPHITKQKFSRIYRINFAIRYIRVLLYHRKLTTRIEVSRIGINNSQKNGRSEDEGEEKTSISHQKTIRNA